MPHRYIGRKIKRFFIYRVLHVDDTPHRIALGLAIGIFITWTPTMGLQMVLTILLATLMRANKFVGVPFVWISNPVTAVPLYGMNYFIGTCVLPGDYSLAKFTDSVSHAVFAGGSWTEKIAAWWSATIDFFWPLWIGSVLVGLVLAVVTYFAIRYAVVEGRRRWHRRHGTPGPLAKPLPAADPSDTGPAEPSDPPAHAEDKPPTEESADQAEPAEPCGMRAGP